MKALAPLALGLTVSLGVAAQEQDCLRDAKDAKALAACGLTLTEPLESRVAQQMARIRAKYPPSRDLDFLLGKSKQSWDEYRNNHCYIEGVLDRKGTLLTSELEQGRQFMRCVLRTLQHRLVELESL